MQTFTCRACDHLVFFENSICLHCGRSLGFVTDDWTMTTFDAHSKGSYPRVDGTLLYRRCANATLAACNWMVPDTGSGEQLCYSCALTRARPRNDDQAALVALAAAEAAKRRLIFQLHALRLPITSRTMDPDGGLAFDLLSSAAEKVVTGHDEGVITLDLAESDDAHRTKVQQRLGEPYRTLLGHFRHEIGHYYWSVFFGWDAARLAECRALFGDDEVDYQEAIDRHYAEGPEPGWENQHVSSYATMHPYEDWAETFAHYLHIRDTLQTAAAYGMQVAGPARSPGLAGTTFPVQPAGSYDGHSIDDLLAEWLPLTYALNAVNRSMGKDDLYPFVLAPAVVSKLAFVHDTIGAFAQPLAAA